MYRVMPKILVVLFLVITADSVYALASLNIGYDESTKYEISNNQYNISLNTTGTFIPYTGATSPIDFTLTRMRVDGFNLTSHANFEPINHSLVSESVEGTVYYDLEQHALSVHQNSDVTLQIGQESFIYVKATETIKNGQVVYISGASGQIPQASLAIANQSVDNHVIGVATENLSTNNFGYITTFGIVRDLDTSAFNDGDIVYLSSTQRGNITKTPPQYPNYQKRVGFVAYSHSNKGKIYVHPGIEFNVTTFNNLGVTLNTTLNNLVVLGNFSAKRPYGMFSSTQTQTISVANTAYPITFNWTEDAYLINKASDNANFTFAQTGDYLIELSAIVDVDTPNKHIEIWVQKNGVNIPRSNTLVQLDSASTEMTLVVPFILDMNTTDVMRIMYASDDAGSRLLYTTNTSYSPETPSIIMTITKISEIT